MNQSKNGAKQDITVKLTAKRGIGMQRVRNVEGGG